jgi:hypothetical protein
MLINITIVCDSQAGVILRIVGSIKRGGVSIVGQSTKHQDDRTIIDLSLEGKPNSLKAALRETAAMDNVVSVKLKRPTEPGTNSEASAGSRTPSQRSDGEPSAIAQQVATAFPDIEELLADYKDTLEADTTAATMRELGQQVAELRKQHLATSLDDSWNLADLIEQWLIPEIAKISKAQFDEEGLKLMSSIFTKPQKKNKSAKGFGFSLGAFDDAPSRCDFLSGYMQGLISQAKQLNGVSVTESFCRNEGQPYCLFEANEAE